MNKTFKVERKGKQTLMTTNEQEAKKWNKAGASGVTPTSVEQSRAKAATMLWIDTEPCYAAETNAHITAFLQRKVLAGLGMPEVSQ